MAAEARTKARAVRLRSDLERAPHDYDFFQAVRSLESLHRDKPRMGRSRRPVDDPIRLGQAASLAFAASSLAAFEAGRNGGPPRLTGHFFGLLGPNGPLPIHLTEYAYDRQRNSRDPTLVRFLDIFHHRMLALLYRAWSNARPAVSYDRPEEDWFGVYLASLVGLGMEPLRNRDALPDHAKLHHAGRMSVQTRNPGGLRAMIAEFFRVPARIEEFVGAWLVLPNDGRLRLGESRATGLLGGSAVAGARIWSRQHKFRVVMGPMDLASYRRLLPGGRSLDRLVALARNYVGDELAWDLNLVLARDEVPAVKLGGDARLGWSAWLGRRREETDAGDLILGEAVLAEAASGKEMHHA